MADRPSLTDHAVASSMPFFSRPLLVASLVCAIGCAVGAATLGAQTQRIGFPRVTRDSSMLRSLGTIDGFVGDTSLAPVHAAFVTIVGTKIRVGTGPNGRFRIVKVPQGQYLVIVKRIGYRPVSAVVDVPASDTLRLSYTLEESGPMPTVLGTMVTTEKAKSARMAEFDQRRKLGQGEFMTEAEIDRKNTVFATELLRNFGTINVSPSHTSAMTEYYALSKREGGNPSLGACPMTVYLDQVPLPTPFNLDLLPSPKELAGIEVYAGSSTIPPQFNGYNRGCGVILVWTKDG
jgi:hypothetical protein